MTTMDADGGAGSETVAVQGESTRWAPVVAMGLAMLVVTAELTMAAVTLPGIGAHFGVGPAATAWVLLAYSLPMAALAIPLGRWADGADVRMAFLVAMVGIGLASVLAALAPAFWVLLVGRAVQGMSAGLVVAVYMPIVAASVRPAQRGRAMGYIITIMTLGGMVGVPLGGLVAGAMSWREVFLLKLPLLLIVCWLGWRRLPRSERGLPLPDRTLVLEAAVLATAVAAVLLGVDQLVGNAVAAVLLLVLGFAGGLLWRRLRSSQPVLVLLRSRGIGGMLLALLAMSTSMGVIAFLLPYLIAEVIGGSAELTGVVLLFFVGAMAPAGPLAGWLADRYGPGLLTVVGAAGCVAGMLLLLGLSADAGVFDMAWRLAVFGVGVGLFNAPMNTALLASTPPELTGTSGGLMMTARTIATTIGPVLAATCWTVAGGGLAGFRTGVLVLTAFAVLAMLILIWLLARRRLQPVAQ